MISPLKEYPVGKFSGRCSKCGRPLTPGEVYYARIRAEAGQYVREDFDPDCWDGSASDALCAWRARVPDRQTKPKRRRVPTELLLDVLRKLLEEQTDQSRELSFILTLLLMRRRALYHLETAPEGDRQAWVMQVKGSDERIRVPVPPIEACETESLAQRLADLLAGLEEEAEALAASDGSPGTEEQKA